MFDQIVPWKSFKEASEKLNDPGAEYSKECANLLGGLKTQLMNIIDAYDSSTQTFYELCGIWTPLLTTYTKLFTDGTASKQTVQRKFMV